MFGEGARCRRRRDCLGGADTRVVVEFAEAAGGGRGGGQDGNDVVAYPRVCDVVEDPPARARICRGQAVEAPHGIPTIPAAPNAVIDDDVPEQVDHPPPLVHPPVQFFLLSYHQHVLTLPDGRERVDRRYPRDERRVDEADVAYLGYRHEYRARPPLGAFFAARSGRSDDVDRGDGTVGRDGQMPPEVIHDGSGRYRRRVDRRLRREHGARLLLLRRLVRFGPAAVAGGTGEDEGDGIAVGDDEPRRSVRERDGPAGGIRVGGCFVFFILFFVT
jgi:hypothetical protein